jgi:hypothetical protein
MVHRQRRCGIEAVERVAVMAGDENKIVLAEIRNELDRRRKSAVERGDGPFADSLENEIFLRRRNLQHTLADFASVRGPKRQVAPVLAKQPESERNEHR